MMAVGEAPPDPHTGSAVVVRHVSKRFGNTIALRDVSLDVRKGEFISLLGSSGCGKTTLLRIIGGFELPTIGDILMGNRSILRDPPYRRPTNMIFQHLALFPHLSVAQNISFGLDVKKLPAPEARRRVQSALSLVNLSGYEERQISQLSGGQRQRVAIARALVNEPAVLLLDEPLASLDLQLRLQMQEELRRIHQEAGTTFIFVTHDQGEAIVLSDRIAVMEHGQIVQLGTPREIYERPQTAFVAKFIGHANLIEGHAERFEPDGSGRGYVLTSQGRRVTGTAPTPPAIGTPCSVFLRYEKIQIMPPQAGMLDAGANVLDKTFIGATIRIRVRLDDGLLLVAEVPATEFNDGLAIGDRVCVDWSPQNAIILSS